MTDYTTDTHDNSNDAEQSAFEEGKRTTENRGMMIFVGLVTLLAGVVAISMPFFASLAATLFLGWLLIASGAVGLVTAFRRHAGWHIAAAFGLAVLSILVGILILLQPLAGILALSTIIIAYFAASGVLRIYYGARMWGEGGGWMLATGALSFVLAVLLWLGLPLSAAWIPGVLLGVDLVVWGSMLIALSLRSGRRSAV